MPTDRQYTGQRREASLGFYDYVARQYDPALGRFLQADTIVPNPANPQSLNRYSYTLGNPLRYTDPSGHFEVPEGECGELCQLLGFSDWDIFHSWWSTLGETLQLTLTSAKWGSMLSFTAYGQEFNLMFVNLDDRGASFKDLNAGILSNASLGFWDNDCGISLDFSTGLRTWQERDGYSTLIRYGEPGHPWGDRDIIEGRNEIVCFEDTFYRTQLQYNRYATEGAVLILGNIALPKPLTWLVTALDTEVTPKNWTTC